VKNPGRKASRSFGVFPPCLRASVPLCLLLAFTGCEQVQSMLDAAPKPTAKIAGVRLDNLSIQDVTLGFDVDVTNPYGVTLPLANLGYALSSGGQSLLSGELADPGSIPARKTKRLAVPVKVRFMDVMNVLQGVRPGSVIPYEANLSLSANAPGFGPVTLPLKHTGNMPVPAVPEITLADVQWEKLSLTNASAKIRLGVVNTNDFALKLSKLNYALSLGGTEVADTSVSKAVNFSKKGDQQTIEIPISIKPINLGMAFFNMLSGEGSGYRIHGDMLTDTPFGKLNMPYDSTGNTVFKK